MSGNGAVKLIHSDNPKFYKDENGQWWAKSTNNRTRKLVIRVCKYCEQKYLVRAKSATIYCSRKCFGLDERGENNPNWIAGRKITAEGYILVKHHTHPNRSKHNNDVLEHRLVMEQILGRYLEPYENVHHRNGIRTDNRPENLELWVKKQPSGARFSEAVKHCPTCTCCTQVGDK